MDIEILREALKNSDIDKGIELIKEVGRSRQQEAIPLLIEYMETTNNNHLRNTIAIALSDIGNPCAIKPIINVLQDTKTIGSRGTLLYALESFDCSQYIELFVDSIINGGYEESIQSFSLIESFNSYIPSERIDRCILKLQKGIDKLEEKIDLLSGTLDVLEGLGEKHKKK